MEKREKGLNEKIQKIEESLLKNNQKISEYKAKITKLQKKNSKLEAEKASMKNEEIIAFMRESGKDIDDLRKAFSRNIGNEHGGMVYGSRHDNRN